MNMISLPNQKRGGSTAQFPGKLHDMMDYVEKHGHEDAISWVMDGEAFMINDPEKLVEILPLFFSQTKYRSFRRQLNGWRFERILDGPNRGAFHHPHFVKGKKVLCSYMTRNTCPSKKSQKSSNNQKVRSNTNTSSSLSDKLKLNQASSFPAFYTKSTNMHFSFDGQPSSRPSNKFSNESSQDIISSVRQIMDEAAKEITSSTDASAFENDIFSSFELQQNTQRSQPTVVSDDDENLGFFDIDTVFEDETEKVPEMNFLMEQHQQQMHNIEPNDLFGSSPVATVTSAFQDMDSFW